MSVPIEVATSAFGSGWVSDLVLRDAASGLAGAFDSGSGCDSGLPWRMSMTPPSTTISSSSSRSPSAFRLFVGRGPHLGAIALAQAVPHVHPYCLVSSGFASSLTTHTPSPHHPWAPSCRLCMKTGSPATRARCGFSSSTVGGCRHRSSVGGDDAPVGGGHSHSLASPHLVSGVLSDHVGINEIVLEQA